MKEEEEEKRRKNEENVEDKCGTERLLLSNDNTPTDSTSSPDDLMQQRQIYSKGFLDALRVLQGANNFEFRPATSPIIPPLGTPGTGPTAITPASPSDYQQIMYSLFGTPTATTTGASSIAAAATVTSATVTSSTVPLPPNDTPLLSSPTLTSLADNDVLKRIYASAVLPGPALSIQQHLAPPQPNIIVEPPIANSSLMTAAAAAAAAASTSRPDKLNLPPPRIMIDQNFEANSSDDSDGTQSYTSKTTRNINSREMTLDDQERKKLDRKRARNRQAATKCRQKKMDRIRELEEQVSNEKARAARLNNELNQLQSVLTAYREAVSNHQSRGCRAS